MKVEFFLFVRYYFLTTWWLLTAIYGHRIGWDSVLHFGIHSVERVPTHLVHPPSFGLGNMVPIQWQWPKGEVRLKKISHTICRLWCFAKLHLFSSVFCSFFSFLFFFFFHTIAVRANFEFINKLGVDRWCFHDRDIAPEGKNLEVSCEGLKVGTIIIVFWTVNFHFENVVIFFSAVLMKSSLSVQLFMFLYTFSRKQMQIWMKWWP